MSSAVPITPAETAPLPCLLYLTHRVPYPPDKGDRIRTYHLLRQLARRSRVWLACLSDEPVTPDTRQVLEGLCERVAIVPNGRAGRSFRMARHFARGKSLSEGAFHQPRLRAILREWTAQQGFDVVIASASSLAPYLDRDGLEKLPAVVDVMDVDSQKWFDFTERAGPVKRWLFEREGERVRALERRLPRRTRTVSLVSRAEAEIFENIAGAGTTTAAANGVDLDYFQPQDVPEALACAFVGALDYLPNVDAAQWFADQVWPQVHTRFPAAEFWLVGRQPTAAVQRLARRSGVKLIGQVPDVRPHLAAAAVAVVPLQLARGLQNKVLEALAMAKATIASPAALAALAVKPGEHLLSATTPRDWIDALTELFQDSVRRYELGQAGRRFVEHSHDWEHCLEPLLKRIFEPTPSRNLKEQP